MSLSSTELDESIGRQWLPKLNLNASNRRILSSGQWLTDKHVRAALMCLAKQFPSINGLQDTLLLYEFQQYNSTTENMIQIINVNQNHWVCLSTINASAGVIDVFDSMPSLSRTSMSLQYQAAAILKTAEKEFTLRFIDVQRQNGTDDCALFALAFAVALCNGRDPHSSRFMQPLMRSHLEACLENENLSEFPSSYRRPKKNHILATSSIQVYCTCHLPWNKYDNKRGPIVVEGAGSGSIRTALTYHQ